MTHEEKCCHFTHISQEFACALLFQDIFMQVVKSSNAVDLVMQSPKEINRQQSHTTTDVVDPQQVNLDLRADDDPIPSITPSYPQYGGVIPPESVTGSSLSSSIGSRGFAQNRALGPYRDILRPSPSRRSPAGSHPAHKRTLSDESSMVSLFLQNNDQRQYRQQMSKTLSQMEDIFNKALKKLAKTSCRHLPFVSIIVIVPDESEAAVSLLDMFWAEFGEKKSKIYTVGDKPKPRTEERNQIRTICELVLTKLLCANLTEHEKNSILTDHQNEVVLGLPYDLVRDFLKNPPNPREDFVQVTVRSLTYSDVKAGWQCARFTDSTVFVVAVDGAQFNMSEGAVKSYLKEVLTRIKMYATSEQHEQSTSLVQHSECVILAGLGTENMDSIGESLGQLFLSSDARERKPFDELLCRRQDKKNIPLFVVNGQFKVIMDQFHCMLLDPKSSLNQPFPVSAVVVGRQLARDAQQRQAHHPVTETHRIVRTKLDESFQIKDEEFTRGTLHALQRAGLIVYPSGKLHGECFLKMTKIPLWLTLR